MSSHVPPVPRLPSLYASSSNVSRPLRPASHFSASESRSSSTPRAEQQKDRSTSSRSNSRGRIPNTAASRSSLHHSASRSTLQIYSPTANSSTYSLTTSYPNLLRPQSANASRHSLWQPPSTYNDFSTSHISLVNLPSTNNSTSKLLDVKNDPTSRVSLDVPATYPYAPPQQRQLPRWLPWLPDLSLMDEHLFALMVTMALALVVLIVVPCGAVLPPRYVVPLPVNVIVPFHMYPLPGAWDRLYHAVLKNPDTNFIVILSINHGPGDTVWPPGEWIAPIKRLHESSNVQTIGYIDTEGGKRSNVSVREYITTYAGWNNSGIALHGIYFDRTPLRDDDDGREYLKNISATVRHEEGFLEPKLVVHGAGAVPDIDMMSDRADITVVFEGRYEDLLDEKDMSRELKTLDGTRQDYACIVHSVPNSVSRGGIRKIIDMTRRNVEWLYLTDQEGDARYEGYSGRWEEFLSLIW